MGKILELKGDREQALESLRALAGDFPDSVASREAWYRVGILMLQDLSQTDEAKKAFEEVQKHKARTTESWVGDADIRIQQIEQLKQRLAAVEEAKADSLKKARARFDLAELYMFSFNRPDSALTQYRLITKEAPGSDIAVRSEYFIGLQKLRDDKTYSEETDRELMRSIVDKFPASTFSQELKVHLGVIENSPEDQAFREAENAHLEGKEPAVYMPLFRALADSFPETKVGAKALFVMAYYYEHELKDLKKANELYTELSKKESIAGKEYVQLAKDKLEFSKTEADAIKEVEKRIAFLAYEQSQMAVESPKSEQAAESAEPVEEEPTGYRKIRARNARIRSRYYTN
jgi:TolA-binding protein